MYKKWKTAVLSWFLKAPCQVYNKTVQATENKVPCNWEKKNQSLVYQTYGILLQAQQKLNTKKNRYQGRAEKEGSTA